MVQYPTNIYPENATFDAAVSDDNNKIAFTFNGDIMSGVLYHVFDYNTGELVFENATMWQDHRPIGYNGTEFETDEGYLSSLTNGKDYALQLLLPQFTADGTQPLCDMFVLRGTTQENYIASDGYIVIEDKISSIYEWSNLTEEGWRNIVQWFGVNTAVCQIVIGDQKRTITAYQASTGKAVISEAFTGTIPAGTKYQIYCNYKVSDLYYFKCRSVPTASLTLEIAYSTGLVHRVTGSYSQAQNSLISYYSIALYYSTFDTTVLHKIDETEKIYSQKIEYDFYDDFILRYKNNDTSTILPLHYQAVITICTVDGMVITQKSNILDCRGSDNTCPQTTITAVIGDGDRADTFYQVGEIKHSVALTVSPNQSAFPSGTQLMWYRENSQTGETEIIEEGTDVSVSTKGNYRYYVVPTTSEGIALVKGVSSAEVSLNMNGYTITELILMPEQYQYGTRPRYKIGDQWKFVGEIQDTTVTQNTDRFLHVGYATYPTLTRTDTNYMTGTLSAMSGYVDCTTHKYVEDIDLIRAWRDFITRPVIYMLKSQKGDVWIVNITDTPTTTYSEMQKDIPTTFAFSWAECCNVNDIKILYHPASN